MGKWNILETTHLSIDPYLQYESTTKSTLIRLQEYVELNK